jgi:hypothetical protein
MALWNHRTHRVASLPLLAAFVLASLALTSPRLTAAATATLVQTINTGAGGTWGPKYSPDPSGITYWPRRNHLVVVDGEVEEMAIWAGANVFQAELTGALVRTYDTTSFTKEPVGIDIEIGPNDHFYISNDSDRVIFDIDLGPDGEFGTADDRRRMFSTSTFGNTDPEGLTLGAGKLYTVDGGGKEVYITEPGSNGIFEASDTTTHFDVERLGIRDPEGIDYDPRTGNLWIVDRSRAKLHEVTTSGALVQTIDLRALAGADNPGDVTLAPGSQDASVWNLYVVERGVDNNDDPNENDGKIYEISVGTSGPPSGNLLANPDFESANGNGQPTGWSTDPIFSRSGAVFHSGTFSGRFASTSEGQATVKQKVVGLSGGTNYNFSAWVNIPTTSDSFVLHLRVKWFTASGGSLSTVTAKTFIDDTAGAWVQTTSTLTAPAGATQANVMLVVNKLSSTIYVDETSFGQ